MPKLRQSTRRCIDKLQLFIITLCAFSGFAPSSHAREGWHLITAPSIGFGEVNRTASAAGITTNTDGLFAVPDVGLDLFLRNEYSDGSNWEFAGRGLYSRTTSVDGVSYPADWNGQFAITYVPTVSESVSLGYQVRVLYDSFYQALTVPVGIMAKVNGVNTAGGWLGAGVKLSGWSAVGPMYFTPSILRSIAVTSDVGGGLGGWGLEGEFRWWFGRSPFFLAANVRWESLSDDSDQVKNVTYAALLGWNFHLYF